MIPSEESTNLTLPQDISVTQPGDCRRAGDSESQEFFTVNVE